MAAGEIADRLDGDEGGEDEELNRDEPLGALLRVFGEQAAAAEAPDDHQAGEPLDRRVNAEPHQRDRPRDQAGGKRHGALDAHVGEAGPGQPAGPARQPQPLAPRYARRRRRDGRGHTVAPAGELGLDERVAALGERVEDDLAVAARVRQPGVAQLAQVVAHGFSARPAIQARSQTHSSIALAQRERDQQAGWVAEGLRARRGRLGQRGVQLRSDRLGAWQVDAEQVTAIIGHGPYS